MLKGSEECKNILKKAALGVQGFVLCKISRRWNTWSIWKLLNWCCHTPWGRACSITEVPYCTAVGGCKNWCWAHVITWTPAPSKSQVWEGGGGSAPARPGSGGHSASMQSVTMLLTRSRHWHTVTQRKLKLSADSNTASWSMSHDGTVYWFTQHPELVIYWFHKVVLMEFMQFAHSCFCIFSPFYWFSSLSSPHRRDLNQSLYFSTLKQQKDKALRKIISFPSEEGSITLSTCGKMRVWWYYTHPHNNPTHRSVSAAC